MRFSLLGFVLFVQGAISSRDNEVRNIFRVLAKNCQFIQESTLKKVAERVVDLYDQVKVLWEVEFEDLPKDLMIWDRIFDQRPSLRESAQYLSYEASEIFKHELVNPSCMVVGAFFTNIVRLGLRENYLMTRLFMEHTSWIKMDLSLLLQLKHKLRLITLEDKYSLRYLKENSMLQLEEYTLYGYRLALPSERIAYVELSRELSKYKQPITSIGTHEADLQLTCLNEGDKHKILECLSNREDLITIDGISHVKRTSDFFPVFYWMSIYYKMTDQPDTRVFEFTVMNFKRDFDNFYKFFPFLKLLSPKNPRQRMEIIVLFNVFSTFGRYLGMREDYLSLKKVILSVF